MPLLDNALTGVTRNDGGDLVDISSQSAVQSMGSDGAQLLQPAVWNRNKQQYDVPFGTGSNWRYLRRPFIDDDGKARVFHTKMGIPGVDRGNNYTVNDSRGGEKRPVMKGYLINELCYAGYPVPLLANAATLRKEEWIQLDRTVVPAARERLRVAADLEAACPYGGFNAIGKSTLEYQAMSDPGRAVVDMDLLTDATTDTPLFLLRSVPLPWTHCDFGYSDRELQISRNGGTGLDVTMGEVAGRRVGESIEDQTAGLVTGIQYGTQTAGYGAHNLNSQIFGYRNYTNRNTKTNNTIPTGSNASTIFSEILAAIEQLYADKYYGPYVMYHSTEYSRYMNDVFSVSGGNHPGETLRSMLMKIPDIRDVRRVDRWDSTYGFQYILVQMTPEVCQMVTGVDVTTYQWQEKGGLALRFKVGCIKVPRMKSDYSGNCGILHGTTS